MLEKPHSGKVALVTGGGRGLGQAFCQRLAQDGAIIVIVDIAACVETETILNESGAEFTAYVCDVSSEREVASLAASVARDIGRVDILVNNAGVYPFALFEDIDFQQWRRVMAVNLDGTFLTCKTFFARMRKGGWGRIINIATNAFINGGDPMLSHYIASKGGVIGLTRALASELGQWGITVNAVAPSLVETAGTVEAVGGRPGEDGADKWNLIASMQAIKRTEQPDDVVGVVSFLASEDARFMTGQTLVVDGGLVRV